VSSEHEYDRDNGIFSVLSRTHSSHPQRLTGDIACLISFLQKLQLTFCKIFTMFLCQYMYTVSQKNCATFLRPIPLEILNSLPNLAQIKVSSVWTSYQSLFKSTLGNSGAIWRITLTVNKKVIKVMNWQRLHHAVVSAMFLTIALLILSTEEKPGWW